MIVSELNANLRSKNINKQIIISLFLKVSGMLLGFAVIPKTLYILGANQYGVWLTILSVVSWLVTFDVGIGNGLRNKLTESLAIDDLDSSRRYISTAYFSLSIIGLSIILVSSVIYPFINWNDAFNTKLISNRELGSTMYLITVAVIINFIIIIVNQVMNAFQQTAYTNIVSILHSSLFLCSLYFFKSTHDLYNVTKFYAISLVLSGIVISIAFYYPRRQYIPKLKWFDLSKVTEILKLGGGFFIIQIATIFMFSISSMLIIQLLTPQDVSVYNVTFRLFSSLTLIFSLIVAPYWSAFTEANKKLDFKWIKTAIFRLHLLLFLTTIVAILLYFFHQLILDLWIGKNKIVPGESVALMMALYSIVLNWSNIYSHYLNGIGKLKLQTIVAVVQAIIIIPLCFLFTKYFEFGLFGIMLSMTLCILPFAILGPIITYKSLKKYSYE